METLFPGLAAMHNFHPLTVHFPIALLVLAFMFQGVVVLGKRDTWQTFSSGLLYLGALAALPTALIGLLAGARLEKSANLTPAMGAALEFHSTVMYIVTGLAVALAGAERMCPRDQRC